LIKTKNKKDKWIKLICGASNEDIVAIEDLCAIYTAAGVDYIDVAAEESIVYAAKKGIDWAKKVFKNSPGLMISISDGNDIHFRKAKFDPLKCPPSCPRPCEKVCPTFAIDNFGIKESKCYGCGRCLNSCPLNLISEYEYNLSKNDLASTLQKIRPNAVEIHTDINRLDSFKNSQDPEDLLKALWERYEILKKLYIPLIWQLDGRPMSGDLAPSTSRDAVKLFEKIGSDLPPGLIQLAGGTNEKTHEFLNSNNLPDGIAFGSAARKIMQPLIEFAHKNNKKLYEYPERMALAIKKAKKFLEPWKSSSFK
jgi:Fe-S-cluster-containing hydrogenase component 2